jgi:transaldolase
LARNPLVELQRYGQSVWLDFIRRGMLGPDGELAALIRDDGLRGVTSNPAIFEKAIVETSDYDAAIRSLAGRGLGAQEIYEALAIEDVQHGADRMASVYEETRGRDGFVSLEVSPRLAHDTDATIAEAHRLWGRLERPNVLIKVPATEAGLPAIRRLIGEGINVNVTLLFSIPRYEAVVEAYLSGLEDRHAKGGALGGIASVASFFLSRIDTLVDELLEQRIASGSARAEAVRGLQGAVAVASARLAYQRALALFAGERWRRLSDAGARTQRLLWASTSTKNPKYSDVLYVDALVGTDTVNTMPLETIEAYRDHGRPAPRIEEDLDACRQKLETLGELGIDLAAAAQQLEDEGVDKFVKPFEKLLATIDRQRNARA